MAASDVVAVRLVLSVAVLVLVLVFVLPVLAVVPVEVPAGTVLCAQAIANKEAVRTTKNFFIEKSNDG
jgi:hypothetical protein